MTYIQETGLKQPVCLLIRRCRRRRHRFRKLPVRLYPESKAAAAASKKAENVCVFLCVILL